MRFSFKKTLAGAAALAVIATVAPFVGSATASAATSNGSVTLGPLTTGNSATNFTLGFPATPTCPGDTATGLYNWASFLVPASVNLNTQLQFSAGGPIIPSGYSTSLIDTGGNVVVAQATSVTTAIISSPAYNFSLFTPGEIPAGAYQIGVACYKGAPSATQVETYWSRPVTITASNAALGGPAQFTYAQGVVSPPPTVTGSAGNAQITYDIAPPVGADPLVTSYTVTIPGAPGSPFTISGAAGFNPAPVTLTGLTNGTAYSVTATATNAAGTSPASTALVLTPAVSASPGATGLSALPGAPGQIILSWTAPAASPATLTGYRVTVPGAPGSPFTVTAPATTLSISSLVAGTQYSWSVEALYATPNFSTAVNGTPFTVNGSAFVYQDITVTRPADALVLTQVCGRYGSMPVEPWTTVPGLGGALTAAGPGTIPTGEVAARFAEYPFPSPATYPTRCGVNMGTARLVTTGPSAGAFFAAEGRLNQVTVVDTRASNPAGWTVNGKIDPTFVSGAANFSGAQLGWTPVVTSSTTGQTPVAGANIAPNTATGLLSEQPLMSAANGVDLGIAVADARLKLLIPVSAVSGTYTATLTISVI